MDWNINQVEGESLVIRRGECCETSEEAMSQAVDDTIEKAVKLLTENIKDDSRYFLFEWDVAELELSIVITDDEKKNDSEQVVRCAFVQMLAELKVLTVDEVEPTIQEFNESVKFWIKDYLSSCGPFMRYSLIAIFQDENRDTAELL